jgi:hypothetical protein
VEVVEAVGKKERGGQNRMKLGLPQKTGAFLSFTPLLNANVFYFASFFLNLTRFWTKLRVLVLCFPDDFTENSIAIRNFHN